MALKSLVTYTITKSAAITRTPRIITPQLPLSLFLSFLINQYNRPIKGTAQTIQNIKDAPLIFVFNLIVFIGPRSGVRSRKFKEQMNFS